MDLSVQLMTAFGITVIVSLVFALGFLFGRKFEYKRNCKGCAHTRWETMTSDEIDKQLDKTFKEFEKSVKGLGVAIRKAERRKAQKEYEDEEIREAKAFGLIK